MMQSQHLKRTRKNHYMRIDIIEKGNVGSALQKGLSRVGYETKFGHRDPSEHVAGAVFLCYTRFLREKFKGE